MKLPDGASFVDKDGKRRTSARIRWWVDSTRADLTELSMEPLDEKYFNFNRDCTCVLIGDPVGRRAELKTL